MSDVIVIKGRSRTHIVSNSDKGSSWIHGNMTTYPGNIHASINADLTDDYVADLRNAGLEVELK